MEESVVRLSPQVAAIAFSRVFPLRREHVDRIIEWIAGLADEHGETRPATPMETVEACRAAVAGATLDDLVLALSGPSLFPDEASDIVEERLSVASRAFLVALLLSGFADALDDVDALEPDALIEPFSAFVADWVALIAAHALFDCALAARSCLRSDG